MGEERVAPELAPVPAVPASVDLEGLRERASDLRTAANESAQLVRNLHLAFLSYALYLAILVGSTTHEQLLRGTAQKIPLIDVELPLVGVYFLAPSLFVLFHIALLLQFYLHARDLRALDDVVSALPEAEQGAQRSQVFGFPFSHYLIGGHHGSIRIIMRILVWVTLWIIPPGLLLATQAAFVPYHHAWIPDFLGLTEFHQFLVLSDIAALIFFWPRIMSRYFVWSWRDAHTKRQIAFSTVAALIVLLGPWRGYHGVIDRYVYQPILGDRNAFTLSGYGGRVLEIEGGDIAGKQSYADILLPSKELQLTLDLSERDLRGAKLIGLNLVGVSFQNARLQEASLRASALTGAKFSGADLRHGDFSHAILHRASFRNENRQRLADDADAEKDFGAACDAATAYGLADLRGASFILAQILAVDMSELCLDGASLQAANVSGSTFQIASMQGAILDGVRAVGADFSMATMGGVQLEGANLVGAELQVFYFDIRHSNIARVKFGVLSDGAAEIEKKQILKALGFKKSVSDVEVEEFRDGLIFATGEWIKGLNQRSARMPVHPPRLSSDDIEGEDDGPDETDFDQGRKNFCDFISALGKGYLGDKKPALVRYSASHYSRYNRIDEEGADILQDELLDHHLPTFCNLPLRQCDDGEDIDEECVFHVIKSPGKQRHYASFDEWRKQRNADREEERKVREQYMDVAIKSVRDCACNMDCGFYGYASLLKHRLKKVDISWDRFEQHHFRFARSQNQPKKFELTQGWQRDFGIIRAETRTLDQLLRNPGKDCEGSSSMTYEQRRRFVDFSQSIAAYSTCVDDVVRRLSADGSKDISRTQRSGNLPEAAGSTGLRPGNTCDKASAVYRRALARL